MAELVDALDLGSSISDVQVRVLSGAQIFVEKVERNPFIGRNMKNFLALVKERYSCRDYQSRDVEQEKVDYIMECVRFAPSAVNRQPWKFRIVKNEEERAKLCQCYHRDWFATAPMYIIASILHDEAWVRSDGKPHGNIDIAIAVEHLCLAATEQGLATCWVCNFDAALCQSLFPCAENEEPAVLIPLGYAADEAKEKKRKDIGEILK